MAFCVNCGASTDDGAAQCPSCGAVIHAGQPAPTWENTGGYVPPVNPGASAQNDTQDAQENKTMAILAYILFFVPLLAGAHKTSPFVKFHTNQGTVLFLAAAVWGIAYSILSVILLFIPILGCTVP